MSLVGPSGSGKTQLILKLLKNQCFYPDFDKIFYFYQNFQSIYREFEKQISNIEFILNVDFQFIDSLPNDGTKYLLIFDDSCTEICKSRSFEKLATAGRHRGISCIYVKHNLFHQSSIGRDAELQNTHIVLFKSPRDVQQISRLSQQLGLGKQLITWYNDAVSHPFGHLLVDLTPRTPDVLRYCTDDASFPSKYYLPTSLSRKTKLDDKDTQHLYNAALSVLQSKLPEDFPVQLSQGIYTVPMRVPRKFTPRSTRRRKTASETVHKRNKTINI